MTRQEQKARRERAVRLYVERRLSCYQIAARLGLTQPWVSRTLKAAGIPTRALTASRTPEQRAEAERIRKHFGYLRSKAARLTAKQADQAYAGRTYG